MVTESHLNGNGITRSRFGFDIDTFIQIQMNHIIKKHLYYSKFMNLSISILISNEIRINYRSIEHILVIVIPHNTCTLPYSQRQPEKVAKRT